MCEYNCVRSWYSCSGQSFCFHIHRNLNGNEPPITTTMVAIRPKRRTPCKQWMPAVFITILLCCLSLAHAVVTTDGYYKTCEQYRKRLIQVLGSTGHEAEVSLNENLTKLTIRYVLYFYLFSLSYLRLILRVIYCMFLRLFYRLFTIDFPAERFLILWIIYRRMWPIGTVSKRSTLVSLFD